MHAFTVELDVVPDFTAMYELHARQHGQHPPGTLLGPFACPAHHPEKGATGRVRPCKASPILCFHRDQPGNVCVRARVCVRTQDPFAIMCFYRNKPLRLDCGYGPEPKITALGATSAALVSVLAASIREARGALGVVVARPRRINT